MTPAIAVAAPTSALDRYTRSSFKPLRPWKFRLATRSEFVPVAGTWPLPMQAPQVGSATLTPASSRSVTYPSRDNSSRSFLLEG